MAASPNSSTAPARKPRRTPPPLEVGKCPPASGFDELPSDKLAVALRNQRADEAYADHNCWITNRGAKARAFAWFPIGCRVLYDDGFDDEGVLIGATHEHAVVRQDRRDDAGFQIAIHDWERMVRLGSVTDAEAQGDRTAIPYDLEQLGRCIELHRALWSAAMADLDSPAIRAAIPEAEAMVEAACSRLWPLAEGGDHDA